MKQKKFVKRGLVASLLTATVLLSGALLATETQAEEVAVTPIDTTSENVVQGQYLIVFKEGLSVQEMEAEIARYNGKIIKAAFDFDMATVALTDAQYNELIQASQVISAIEPNILFEQLGSMAELQYGLDFVQAGQAWQSDYTGKGIDVAVVDTGISLTNTDLNVVGGKSFVHYTTSYNDDNGHGTHVAGTIGALKNDKGVIGVAYDTNLYAVKVLGQLNKGSLIDIISGVKWAVDKNVDIINLSLGTDSNSPAFHDVIKEAQAKGIFVVASTGNDSQASLRYPAKYPEAIAVGAIDQTKQRATFSNYGEHIDVVAPGVKVLSTHLTNNAYMQGTSMAAPHVSGLLALYKNAYPHLSASEIEQLLYTNAEDLGASGYDTQFGHGLARFPQPANVTPPIEEVPVTPPVEETPVAPPIEEKPVTPPVDETPVTEQPAAINGVTLDSVTRKLDWSSFEAQRYQLAVKKVSNGQTDLGQVTLVLPLYDLTRFKLADNEQYELTITPRINNRYDSTQAIKVGLSTAGGHYSLYDANNAPVAPEAPAPAENPVMTLPNGISIHTQTGDVTWPTIDNASRYRFVLEADATKSTLTSSPTYKVARMGLTENVTYVATIIPYLGSYDESRAWKVHITYKDGKYTIAEYAEQQTPAPTPAPPAPTFEINSANQLKFPAISQASRYRVEVTQLAENGEQIALPKQTRNLTVTQYDLLSLPEDALYQLTIVPYINGAFRYEAAHIVKVSTSDYTLR